MMEVEMTIPHPPATKLEFVNGAGKGVEMHATELEESVMLRRILSPISPPLVPGTPCRVCHHRLEEQKNPAEEGKNSAEEDI
jgi:hypothetical protein